jgi:hypothetical protein
MAERMGKMPPPGLTIIVGTAHGKPSDMGKPGMMGKTKMPPPGMPKEEDGKKASPEEAGVIRADEHCIKCRHYDPISGDCAKVEGQFDPEDACEEYFDAIGNDEPEDEDSPEEEDMEEEEVGKKS